MQVSHDQWEPISSKGLVQRRNFIIYLVCAGDRRLSDKLWPPGGHRRFYSDKWRKILRFRHFFSPSFIFRLSSIDYGCDVRRSSLPCVLLRIPQKIKNKLRKKQHQYSKRLRPPWYIIAASPSPCHYRALQRHPVVLKRKNHKKKTHHFCVHEKKISDQKEEKKQSHIYREKTNVNTYHLLKALWKQSKVEEKKGKKGGSDEAALTHIQRPKRYIDVYNNI